MTSALLTDHYELTMVQAAMDAGTANRRSLFDLFTRRLPEGRRYGVVAGLGRVIDAIENFTFSEAELAFLVERGVIRDNLAHWLADYRFSGDIWGYAEGEVYFPGSPVLSVEGTFAEACLLETVLLSIYNHDSAIAAAASRMTAMAGGRACAEMGSRRTHEWSAVAAARAAYLAGFASSSNLEAGRTYGIPTIGTAAHSFTLLHDTEEDAFRAQIAALGENTTLLVDTYDVEAAIRKGVELTQGRLGSIRLDSGDLAIMARQARDLLDDLGATDTRIMVTSDLDEWQIAMLQGAPVDGYGVGTSLVTGSGHPTCGFVYKLVARADSASPRTASLRLVEDTMISSRNTPVTSIVNGTGLAYVMSPSARGLPSPVMTTCTAASAGPVSSTPRVPLMRRALLLRRYTVVLPSSRYPGPQERELGIGTALTAAAPLRQLPSTGASSLRNTDPPA